MFKLSFTILVFLFLVLQVKSQDSTAVADDFKEAQYFFDLAEYEEALYYYQKLLKLYPENAHWNFRVGECLLKIKNKGHFAAPYLQKSLTNLNEKFKKNDVYEKSAPYHALYYLGRSFHLNDMVDSALNYYDQFMKSDLYDKYNAEMVERTVDACKRAKAIRENPIDCEWERLPRCINKTSSEYNPVISDDGQKLFFMRSLKFYQGVFMSDLSESGEWTEPRNINGEIRSDGDMVPSDISPDGKHLLLTRKYNDQEDIYISTIEDGVWSPAISLGDKINTLKNEGSASFGHDGSYIMFSTDKKSAFGYNIFRSDLNSDGTWGEPYEWLEQLNTEHDEVAPKISSDGKRIYFSSNGHFSMGGYDVFYLELKNNKWIGPKNIGYPINNSSDNLDFFPIQDRKEALISKYELTRPENEELFLVKFD